MPAVSVIIATYNRANLLPQAIDSVLAQTYTDWELIVVNDGSTDATADIVQRYRQRDPRIQLVTTPNGGLSKARNTGIRTSQGEYLAFLDDDDVWLAEKLERQVGWLNAHPHIGLLYSRAHVTDQQLHRVGDLPKRRATSLTGLLEGNCVPLPTVLVRRSCLDQVGLFDERLSCTQDYDLWLRIAHVTQIACLDEALVLYRRHGENMTRESVTGRHERIEIYKNLMRRGAAGLTAATLRRRIAQEYYTLGRIARNKRAYLRAAGCFARSVAAYPRIGLQLPGMQSNASRLLLIAKPYLAVGYCAMRGLRYAHR